MSDFDKLLPSSRDAEAGLLCSILLDPAQIGSMCAEKKITSSHFHFPEHREIFDAITAIQDAKKQVDPITLTTQLRDSGKLENVGGAAYVSEIFTLIPTTANARNYIQIVEEKFMLREVIRVCTETAERSYDEQGEAPSIIDDLEQKVGVISQSRNSIDHLEFSHHLMGSVDRLQEAVSNKGRLPGISTGLKDLDSKTGGLCKKQSIIVSAETGGGKTALALKFVETCLCSEGPVLYFSYEMDTDELTDRLICMKARVDLLKYSDGTLSDFDLNRVNQAVTELSNKKLIIYDDASISILQLRAIARKIARKLPLKLIVVDYLQLIPSSFSKKSDNREREVADISRQLRALAKELSVPLVALSQLNDEGKMRESRAIAQDANLLLVIQEELDDNKKPRHFVKIGKQRRGPKARVPVTFLAYCTRFENFGTAPED